MRRAASECVANHACGGDHDRGPLEDRYSGDGAESGDWPRGRNGLHQLPVLPDARVVGVLSRAAHTTAFGDAHDSALEDLAPVLRTVLAAWHLCSTIPTTTPLSRARRLAMRAANTSSGTAASFPAWRYQPALSSVRAWLLIRRYPNKRPTHCGVQSSKSASPLSISLARNHPRGIGTYRARGNSPEPRSINCVGTLICWPGDSSPSSRAKSRLAAVWPMVCGS
jgi:hypothetical protein